MKKNILNGVLFLCLVFLSGCMTTWPIVNDLDHYKKWDTYESIRENDEEEEVIEEDSQELLEDAKAIENCINSRNNDPKLYEDESVIELHNQFETTEDFCIEFIKTNPMFYNDSIWIDESWEQVWRDLEAIESH